MRQVDKRSASTIPTHYRRGWWMWTGSASGGYRHERSGAALGRGATGGGIGTDRTARGVDWRLAFLCVWVPGMREANGCPRGDEAA